MILLAKANEQILASFELFLTPYAPRSVVLTVL